MYNRIWLISTSSGNPKMNYLILQFFNCETKDCQTKQHRMLHHIQDSFS